jgi:hypothetical protein
MSDGWTVISQHDDSWDIGIRLLSSDQDGALICFFDEARNGGSYRAQSALKVARGPDGLFHSRRIMQSVRGCASVP